MIKKLSNKYLSKLWMIISILMLIFQLGETPNFVGFLSSFSGVDYKILKQLRSSNLKTLQLFNVLGAREECVWGLNLYQEWSLDVRRGSKTKMYLLAQRMISLHINRMENCYCLIRHGLIIRQYFNQLVFKSITIPILILMDLTISIWSNWLIHLRRISQDQRFVCSSHVQIIQQGLIQLMNSGNKLVYV